MNAKESAEKKKVFDGMAPAVMLSAAASFLLFIYGPVEQYIGNYLDFNFDFFDLMRYMPIIMLCVFALSVIVMFALKKLTFKYYVYILLLYFAAFLATYVQGTFFAGNLPLLDGADINWKEYDYQRIYSVLIWIASVALAALLLKFIGRAKFSKTVFAVSLAALVYLVLTFGLNCVSNPKALKAKNTTCMTADSALKMSSDKENFIIFLMDGVDAEVFSQVMEDNPEYKEVFADFTCFPDNMGSYAYTTKAVPFILFGKWYDNTIYYPYYIQDAIGESPFIRRLDDRDYDMSIYFEYIERANLDATMFENFRDVRHFNEPDKFCKMIIMLTGLRYLPYDFKPMCALSPDNIYFDTLKTNENEDIDYYDFELAALNDRFSNSSVTYSDKNCFRFLYCSGAHYPYRYDRNAQIIENGTYYQNVEATIAVADTYLRLLKEYGVYDNSVIVFLADHGMNQSDEGSDYEKQNPYLLIKGRNEDHDFQIDNAPVSHADLDDAFLNLLDGATSNNCFKWKEGDKRERRYMLSGVGIQDPLYEYVQTGYASNMDTLVPTGNVYEFDWACVDAREAEEKAKR